MPKILPALPSRSNAAVAESSSSSSSSLSRAQRAREAPARGGFDDLLKGARRKPDVTPAEDTADPAPTQEAKTQQRAEGKKRTESTNRAKRRETREAAAPGSEAEAAESTATDAAGTEPAEPTGAPAESTDGAAAGEAESDQATDAKPAKGHHDKPSDSADPNLIDCAVADGLPVESTGQPADSLPTEAMVEDEAPPVLAESNTEDATAAGETAVSLKLQEHSEALLLVDGQPHAPVGTPSDADATAGVADGAAGEGFATIRAGAAGLAGESAGAPGGAGSAQPGKEPVARRDDNPTDGAAPRTPYESTEGQPSAIDPAGGLAPASAGGAESTAVAGTPPQHANPSPAAAAPAGLVPDLSPKAAPAAPAAGTLPATPPEARFADDNHANIVREMRTQLMPDGGTMRIRLDPPELGPLAVTVRLRNGAMEASFEASNEDAAKLLSHSLGALKSTLESHGVTVERLNVQQAPKTESASRQDNGGGRDGQQQGHERDLQQEQSARQEQQRREMMRRMWRKLSGTEDPLDMVA